MTDKILAQYPALKPFVKEVFLLEGNRDKTNPEEVYCYADGIPGLMYQATDELVYIKDYHKSFSTLFVFGQTIYPIKITATGKFRIIAFFLYPHVIKDLFRIRADSIVDTCYDINKVTLPGADSTLTRLTGKTPIEEEVNILAQFLTGLVPKGKAKYNLSQIIAELNTNFNEAFELKKLSQNFTASERTIQRKFKENVGISPRLYARVRQFNSGLAKLKAGEFSSLSELAYMANYTDQSHFIKAFKEFTGMTPTEFIRNNK